MLTSSGVSICVSICMLGDYSHRQIEIKTQFSVVDNALEINLQKFAVKDTIFSEILV